MLEENKSYYAVIPANVRYDKDLTANAKLLYGEITALCNEKGFCWASNEYFASLYNVAKQTVSTWISQLAKKRYIAIEIIYKEGSKEILNRYMKISEYPIKENLNTPIKKNMKENNTSFNNTFNNIIPFSEIILYLNEKLKANYKHTSTKNKDLIKARWNEGYRVDDFKTVIDKKVKSWTGTEFEKFLRPETLFSNKFEGYLNEKEVKTTSTNKFHNYEQDKPDFDDLMEKARQKRMSEMGVAQ